MKYESCEYLILPEYYRDYYYNQIITATTDEIYEKVFKNRNEGPSNSKYL